MAHRPPLRPLAPLSGPAQHNQNPVPTRRINSSVACLACKERKSKCSGGNPCQRCSAKSTECYYDETTDQRRRIHMKRKIESLEVDRNTLIRLCETLRDGSDSNANAILNLIRSDPPLSELKSYIDTRLQERASPEIVDAQGELCRMQNLGNKAPRRASSVKQLAGQPPLRVPAKPWTTVTEDDAFVSHLISLYFTWYHPCFPWIDRELFIRDMKAGQLNAKFCSPFLVNVLLADACAYSDHAGACKDPNVPSTRGEHFYDEAQKCLEEEQGRFTISTIQGLCALSVCAFLMGKEQVGWISQGQLGFEAKELHNSIQDIASRHGDDITEEERVRTSTLWGLYSISMASSVAHQKSPMIETPTVPPPKRWHDNSTEEWHSYPVHSKSLPWHSTCHFSSLCDLAGILHNWCSLMLGGSQKPAPEKMLSTTDEVVRKLTEWEAGLSDCLGIDDRVKPLPQVLCLHMYYHNILITVHGLAKAKNDDEENKKQANRGNSQEVVLQSARQIAKLVELHRASWGIDIFPASHIQWVSISLNTLLEDLESPQSKHAFVSLSIAAKAASRRWVLAKEMLLSIQLTARKMAISLPPETDALFAEFENCQWSPKDRDGLSSLYPNFALRADANEHPELDRFLERSDAFGI